jgi:hypothetical protein
VWLPQMDVLGILFLLVHTHRFGIKVLNWLHFHKFVNKIRGCIQTFPDWVDKEIYAYNNKHSLISNTKG